MNTILKSEMMLQGRVYDTKFTLGTAACSTAERRITQLGAELVHMTTASEIRKQETSLNLRQAPSQCVRSKHPDFQIHR